MKRRTENCGDVYEEFLDLASTFQEVAVRKIPRGKALPVRSLARQAIGLPAFPTKKPEMTAGSISQNPETQILSWSAV
jgi:hypothetical protein